MKSRHLFLIFLIWIILLSIIPGNLDLIQQYWHFFFVGLAGAVVANSTGAGGGIIFVPFFSAQGVSASATLGTSILIQSFGMTAGAIGWLVSLRDSKYFSHDSFKFQIRILVIATPPTIIGVICAQYLITSPPFHMLDIFRVFSVIFGALLLFVTLQKKSQSHTRHHLNVIDKYLLVFASFTGGLVTAWISIGIGEIVAILLIMRHVPIMIAVSTGVCLSSISVLTAAPFHIAASDPIWGIVLFAAPAAIIGGTVARFLAFRLGPVRLKIFFAAWILATGLSMQ